MEKWNEHNIEGVEFEVSGSLYIIKEIVQQDRRNILIKSSGNKTSVAIKDILTNFKNGFYKPLTQPANEEIIFSLY